MILHTLRSGDIKTKHGGLWHYFPNNMMFHACWYIGQATKNLLGGGWAHKIGATKLLVRMRYPKGEKSPFEDLTFEWMDSSLKDDDQLAKKKKFTKPHQ
jgi:hypothetical protein